MQYKLCGFNFITYYDIRITHNTDELLYCKLSNFALQPFQS